MNDHDNPFEGDLLVFNREYQDTPARFLSTLYNLGFFQDDMDELDAVEIIMELENILDIHGT